MARPSTTLATLRPELGGGMEEFNLAADRQGFIGMRVFPVFEAGRSGGEFPVIPVAQLLKDAELGRSPHAGYNRDDIEFGKDNFTTKEYGKEEPVDDNDKENYRDYIDAEQVAADRAQDQLLRRHERSVAAAAQNTGTFANTAGTDWSTPASGTPVTDMKAAVEAFWAQCGLWPNAIIIPRHAFRNARECDEVIDRLKYSISSDIKASNITAAILAQLFDVEEVIVPGGTRNLAKEGQAASFSPIWDKTKVTVCRIARTNDLREPCIGRTFHWDGDGSQIQGTMEQYREERIRGDVIRCRHQTQEKVMYAKCGYVVTGLEG